MSGLEFILKAVELKKAIREQKQNGRVVLTISLSDDAEKLVKQQELYDLYVNGHEHRGELGWAKIIVKQKVDGKMNNKKYNVRVVAARFIENRGYQIDIRFSDVDLRI